MYQGASWDLLHDVPFHAAHSPPTETARQKDADGHDMYLLPPPLLKMGRGPRLQEVPFHRKGWSRSSNAIQNDTDAQDRASGPEPILSGALQERPFQVSAIPFDSLSVPTIATQNEGETHETPLTLLMPGVFRTRPAAEFQERPFHVTALGVETAMQNDADVQDTSWSDWAKPKMRLGALQELPFHVTIISPRMSLRVALFPSPSTAAAQNDDETHDTSSRVM